MLSLVSSHYIVTDNTALTSLPRSASFDKFVVLWHHLFELWLLNIRSIKFRYKLTSVPGRLYSFAWPWTHVRFLGSGFADGRPEHRCQLWQYHWPRLPFGNAECTGISSGLVGREAPECTLAVILSHYRHQFCSSSLVRLFHSEQRSQ